MSTITEIKVPEPLVSVQTRVSWGALLAGAVVAIAGYSLLTMLGIAVGFTLSDQYDAEQLGTGAAVWTFASLLISMFFGGWVATRCTAGELRTEAVLYGIVVWGITSTLLIPLTAAGVGLGSGTVLADRGIAKVNDSVVPPMVNATRLAVDKMSNASRRDNNSSASRQDETAGSRSDNTSSLDDQQSQTSESSSTNESTDSSNRNTQGNQSTDSNRSAQTSARVREHLKTVSWWTFAGTFASMLAAIFGALLGPHVVITHHKNVTARPVV
jgi:hypothetical protein